MTSVDDIFKKSGIPSKRKLEPLRDPNEAYKSAKRSTSSTSRQAQVETGPDDDDTEAGPAPPPGDGDDDQDFGPELPPEDGDDEEGRFFGGGITKQESEILDFVEGADAGTDEEKIDAGWLRKMALNFEKRITKNAELRAKYEAEPQRFIESEADLDADIKGLSVLALHWELYGEFAKLGCAGSLVGLLAHENTDIAIQAIKVIGELTEEDGSAQDQSQWGALVDALLEAELLDLLVSNLGRLNEDDEADRNGVYYALSVVENLCWKDSSATQVGKERKLLKWILQRAQATEKPMTQNKQYAAEVLAVLTSNSRENRAALIEMDAVDQALQLVAPYRKHGPEKGSDEEEYMENLFDMLISLVEEAEGKTKLVDAEGVELCLIMVKEGKMSRPSALRLLSRAVGGTPNGVPIQEVDPAASTTVCRKVIDAGGLKAIFTLFTKTKDHQLLSELLAIFASLLRLLPSDSAERIRTLAKFVEKDYEKTVRLVELRREYAERVRRADAVNDEERRRMEQRGDDADDIEEMDIIWTDRRLDAGQLSRDAIDLILAWLVAEDDGARSRIEKLLGDRDETLGSIRETIHSQMDSLNTVDPSDERYKDVKDMLGTLAEFLQ